MRLDISSPRFEVGDKVIINTAHLPHGVLFTHPRSGKPELNLAGAMRQASGKVATITNAKALNYGYMYRINLQPNFFYTSDFLISANCR